MCWQIGSGTTGEKLKMANQRAGFHSYEVSKELNRKDYPFYALIMAAMRKADSYNMIRLQIAFPSIYEELKARYEAPGGMLPEDENESQETVIRPMLPEELIFDEEKQVTQELLNEINKLTRR